MRARLVDEYSCERYARRVGVTSQKRRVRRVRRPVGEAGIAERRGRGNQRERERGGSVVEWSVWSSRRSLPRLPSLRFFPVRLVVRAAGQSE